MSDWSTQLQVNIMFAIWSAFLSGTEKTKLIHDYHNRCEFHQFVHFNFHFCSCFVDLFASFYLKLKTGNVYERRAWQIGLDVPTRTHRNNKWMCDSMNTTLNAQLQQRQRSAREPSNERTGRGTSFIYSIVMKWQNILLLPAYWNRWPMACYVCKMNERTNELTFYTFSVSTASELDSMIIMPYDMQFLFRNYLRVFNFTHTQTQSLSLAHPSMNESIFEIPFLSIVTLLPFQYTLSPTQFLANGRMRWPFLRIGHLYLRPFLWDNHKFGIWLTDVKII